MDGSIFIPAILSVGTVRNWGYAGVVRARLGAGLSALSTGCVDAQAVGRGTCLRRKRAPPIVIHAKLGRFLRSVRCTSGWGDSPAFTNCSHPFNPLQGNASRQTNYCSGQPPLSTATASNTPAFLLCRPCPALPNHYSYNNYAILERDFVAIRAKGGSVGIFSLLDADRVAIPAAGEAGTASLEGILGSECPPLQPGFLLTDPHPSEEALRTVRARTLAKRGNWPRIVTAMAAGRMCEYRELGGAQGNSAFGVLKTDAADGPMRPIFSGDRANLFFRDDAGYADLPSTDVLTKIQLDPTAELFVASSDVSQCYNRLTVPLWMIPLLVMPSV
jgi:hypothetical protein